MMDAHLPQILRGLCLNTEWNYAVFWRFKHHSQMVLTWEDAYYHNCEKCDLRGSQCDNSLQSLRGGCFSCGPLALAVAGMSYHVYSAGEGIIGQVAATGKHRWILADQHALNFVSSSEHSDGWKAQFLAGIQTIVVAAVLPHGVVQLGSLNEVPEDVKLVAHLRDVFSALYDSVTSPFSNSMLESQQNSMNMLDISVNPEILQGCPINLCKPVNGEKAPPKLGQNFHGALIPADLTGALPLTVNGKLVPSISEGVENPSEVHLSYLKQEFKELAYENSCEKNRSMSSYDVTLAANKSGAGCVYPPSDLLVSSTYDRCDSNYNRHSAKDLLNAEHEFRRHMGRDTVIKPEQDCLDALVSSFKPSSGYELHEALRPTFSKQNNPCWWDMEDSQPLMASDLADGTEHSMLTSDTGSDHLLEAVVANFCSKESTSKGRKSHFASADSSLTTEKMMPEASSNTSNTIGSACYSIDCSSLLQEGSSHLWMKSSASYNFKSSKGFSSPGPSICKEQLLKSNQLLKGTKKRSKPGENLRPRPRDRQLIQDRIKELRELVPNGAKCSIDSLLERTIKHMVFLQSVSKHTDKLSNYTRSKAHKDITGLGGSGCDQGASWAVEVGGHMKICPIVVENINLNGQMLIEMLCEQCDHFLEVGEAIRGLGLTILKGATEKQGDKTWMRFVVEGESNRNMHRLDVLWSLVQILQTKTT